LLYRPQQIQEAGFTYFKALLFYQLILHSSDVACYSFCVTSDRVTGSEFPDRNTCNKDYTYENKLAFHLVQVPVQVVAKTC
jgi:hypothetical protein